eukprot:m.11452 g.11452  ORF g.11452 m.11452 type:complete len:830 (+) comp4441_c0_seq2:243-2732(+)
MPSHDRVKAIRDVLRTAAIRENNCQLSLRVSSFDECSFSKGDCFTVTLIGDTAKCQTCEAPQLCRCLRDQFQSTTNSKRRVSTFLFWKNQLGLNFPVSDGMLRRAWKGLDSCANGIKQGNGQRKVARGAVCVNPYHYTPNKWGLVLEALFETLDVLEITEDEAVGKIASSLGWDGKNMADLGVSDEMYEQAFQIVCHRVRKMVDSEGYIERLQSSLQDGGSVDCGYETSSSSGASPPHYAEYFSPSSPPDQFVTAGQSDWSENVPESLPDVLPSPSSHMAPISDELADLDAVLFGNEAGDDGYEPGSEFYIAQQMLPRMQNRLWSAEERADITSYADSLRLAVEDRTSEDDFMDLAEPTADGVGGGGWPWATYMSTQVWQESGAPQFASGVEIPDPTAYGLEQFEQVVPDMVSQYHCMPFTDRRADGTVEMSGDVEVTEMEHEYVQSPSVSSRKLITRTLCKKCKRWAFGTQELDRCLTEGCSGGPEDFKSAKLDAFRAREVPMVKPQETLNHGDVVAMVRHGNSVSLSKADAKNSEEAECIGVFASTDGVARVNIVGFVDVAVSGPVRNLDMLYVDLENPGKATAKPRTGARCLVGQVVDPACASTASADGGDADAAAKLPSTIRCIISSQHLPAKMLSTVTARTAAAVQKQLKSDGSGADARQKAAESRVDAVAATLEKTAKLPTKQTFSRVVDPSECDQCIVAVVGHHTSKALQRSVSGAVDAQGECGGAASQFVLHYDDKSRSFQLQSVVGDDVWVGLDPTGAIVTSADPSDKRCVLSIVPHEKGGFLLALESDVTNCGREPENSKDPFVFSLYRRDAVALVTSS